HPHNSVDFKPSLDFEGEQTLADILWPVEFDDDEWPCVSANGRRPSPPSSIPSGPLKETVRHAELPLMFGSFETGHPWTVQGVLATVLGDSTESGECSVG